MRVDIEAFERDGWLVVPGVLDLDQLARIDSAVAELEQWATTDGPGLHHFELTDTGAVLARSEDFVADSDVLCSLICAGTIVEIIGELFGEPGVLFKEKINYKQPGGGGFAPHQDATAYRFVEHHISCMVPLDPATEASGCLWVAPGYRAGQLPTDARGRIEESVARTLDWRPVPLDPGDLLFFDSYTPHYSETNTTTGRVGPRTSPTTPPHSVTIVSATTPTSATSSPVPAATSRANAYGSASPTTSSADR